MSEGYIGVAPRSDSVDYQTRSVQIAVGGETTFNAVYTVNYLDVFLNGVKQKIGEEVIATNGTSFSFVTPLVANDVVEYNYMKASSPYDYYLKAEIDGFNAAKAPLASPTFTGMPAAPTASPGTNTTQLATTSFVGAQTKGSVLSVTATQGSGALTFGLNSCVLDFRSTVLTTGVNETRFVPTPLSLVLPSGGTLGAVSTVAARLILVAIDNAGTIELAVVNIAGGNDLSETGVINTTAISASSTANNVFYSTTARIGVAYRVVGAVDAINTTGAWGNPTLVQGSGGQALSAMSSLGYGQTWQNMGGSRSKSTTYYNTTGKTIKVRVILSATSSAVSTYYGYLNGALLTRASGGYSVGGTQLVSSRFRPAVTTQ